MSVMRLSEEDRRAQAEREIDAVNAKLREGYPAKLVPGRNVEMTAARAAADELGEDRQCFIGRVGKPDAYGLWWRLYRLAPSWSLERTGERSKPVLGPRSAAPRPSTARRWILSAAQDQTPVHEAFLANLRAYGDELGAELLVSGFSYNKSLFEDHAKARQIYDDALADVLTFDRHDLGPVVFCGDVNTLPTMKRPLTGLTTFTRGRTGIFPHAKVALRTVPVLEGRAMAQVMTTGAVTVPNYIAKRAGQLAEFHHVLGATLVEVDPAGRWFCRQLNASDDGSFYDLDAYVSGGRVTYGHRVEAITHGDIHRRQLDPVIARAVWGLNIATGAAAGDGLVDALRPHYQFYHDLCDFNARNHYRRGDALHHVKLAMAGLDRVEDEIVECARFLRQTQRDFAVSCIVESNHDTALARWLREADWRTDPVNARYCLELNLAAVRAVERGEDDFNPFYHALALADPHGLAGMVFVPETTSFAICQHIGGGIECGQHGHRGTNGARGSARNLSTVGSKMNVGHYHEPQIVDGIFAAGIFGKLDQGYNVGPSSWAQACIVTYSNGKRSIVTLQDGLWRA